jgi:site-specific recombinase XerD
MHTAGLCQRTIDDFAAHLRSQGFAASTSQQYVTIIKRYCAWLRHPRKKAIAIGEESAEAFVQRCRIKDGLRHLRHLRSSLKRWLRMLRDRGELAAPTTPPPTVIDRAVEQFADHLRETCGLAQSTMRLHLQYVRCFLQHQYGNGPLRLRRLCRSDLIAFVAIGAKRWTPACVPGIASALRRYCRFLQLQGICGPELAAAVPTSPRWKLATLPRTMTEQQLQAFLLSFDRETALGRRNYAIAVLMAMLGLRASDVAALRLDDLDWRGSSIRIASPKGRRVDMLPLPHRVGQAIAGYLRHGRPATSARHVFIRHVAPKDTPLTAAAIRQVAICAYRRCGFDPQWKGTHILRHTVAMQLHQRGASLKEVADVLGHRSIETAAVYAKVNLPELASVALPWPEVTA